MSKVQDNDKKIKELKNQIEEQLANLPKISKDFNTNLVLTFRDNQYNLNVVSVETLKELLINLYLYQIVIDKFNMDFTICGYTIECWIMDINKIIEIRNRDRRVSELKESYSKLDTLLSDTAKTSDFLESVEDLLNG